MIFSYSRLKKYTDCPAAFYKKYILELPDPSGEAAVLGKVVHAAVEKYILGTEKTMAIEKAISTAELPVNHKEVNWLMSHEVIESIAKSTHMFKRYQVEEHFRLPLHDKPGSPILQGYIDLWHEDQYNNISVVDWKTNRAQYEPLENHQLGLYAWALSKLTGQKEIFGSLIFLRFKKDYHRHTEYSKDKMEEARLWALQSAQDIEEKLATIALFDANPDELFPAIPNSTCRWCPYASDCLKQAETKGEIITIENINNPEEAKTVAAEVFRLEATLKEMKEQLKEWVQNNGSVQVGDRKYQFCPSESWQFSPEGLEEFCFDLQKSGINPWEMLSIGSNQLKKIGWTEEVLANYAKRKTRNTFRCVKAAAG